MVPKLQVSHFYVVKANCIPDVLYTEFQTASESLYTTPFDFAVSVAKPYGWPERH